MRIFGSESMNNILQKLGLKDGESIDHPWINKALERAQQKVEARNFDIRKTLIKFDNVLNDQRHVIFSQRRNAMDSEQIYEYSNDFLNEIIGKLKIKASLFSNVFDEKIDSSYIVSRAFKKLDKIIQVSREIAKKPHKLLILKGQNAQEEAIKAFKSYKYSYKLEKSMTDEKSKIIVADIF